MTAFQLGSSFYGTFQFSSALTLPPFQDRPVDSASASEFFSVLETKHIEQFRKALREQSLPGVSQFDLERRYSTGDMVDPPYTWLGPKSRHAAIKLGDEFSVAGSPSFPCLLDWPGRTPKDASSTPYVRAQKPRTQGSKALIDGAPCDCNDYLISRRHVGPEEPAEKPLLDLRRFISGLYAERRVRIFNSELSHRIYNVWLPPGLIQAADSVDSAFVILPFVTRVRRPFRIEFRRTMTLSVVIVPVTIREGAARKSRAMSESEISGLVHALEGGSAYAVNDSRRYFRLVDCPLSAYVDEMASQADWPTAAKTAAESRSCEIGSIRQWTELLFTCVAEPTFKAIPETVLADEILRSIRLCTTCSVLVMSPQLTPFDPQRSRVLDGVWWPAKPRFKIGRRLVDGGVPTAIRHLLESIALDDRMPVAAAHRLDDMDCGVASGLIWEVPQHQCIVTAFAMSSERFPDRSGLNLFGWMSHLLVAVASARAMMAALVLEAEHGKEGEEHHLAKTSYDMTLEMEEMFDLKIAWPEYQFVYRRLRERLGIDDMYKRMRARLDQLSLHANVISQHKEVSEQKRQERKIEQLQWLAATLAIGIILVGVWQVFAVSVSHRSLGWAWLSVGSFGVVVAVCVAIGLLYFWFGARNQTEKRKDESDVVTHDS